MPLSYRTCAAFVLFVAVTTVCWTSVQPELAVPSVAGSDKVLHALAFATFTVLAGIAFGRRFLPLSAVALLAVGAAIEVAQHFVPEREGSLGDWLGDFVGVAIGVIAFELMRRNLRARLQQSGGT